MAKTGTRKPLNIVVHDAWLTRPEIVALRAQGHVIFCHLDEDSKPDLILHPKAHFMDDSIWDLLPLAVKWGKENKK